MDKVRYFSTSDQSVGLIEGHYQSFAFSRHYHLDYHFGLILEGQQQFSYLGQRHCVGPGDLVVMPPDELHDGHSFSESGYQSQVFEIDPAWFAKQLDDVRGDSCLSFLHPVIQDPHVFRALTLTHQALRQDNLAQLAQDCLPYEGFLPLLERYAKRRPEAVMPLGKLTIERLREFLLANLSEPVQLAQLASLCDLSPTQFQRHFKATTGITPYAWLTRLRLEQAMKLVKTKLPGTEVAHRVGFYDQAHFSKAFKQAFGISPSEVR